MDPDKMGVRGFWDKYSRLMEIFRDEVESGQYVPLHGTDLNTLHHLEWMELFRKWLAKRS